MAEVKRIQLDSVRPPQREKRTKEVTPTFRFNLPLNESTDSACPEYSYGELVKAARAENGENKTQGADPFGDDDDDDEKLQEIARKYEEKYNPKPGKKRKKKPGDWEDYVDKGMGYDETDPFIDNEEAYDELVPSTLTTQFGGFYINTGELEFRNVSETENGLDEKIRKKRRKREILEKEGRKRRKISNDQMPKRRGRKSANQTESALPKVKKKTQPTVADMLQQHKAQQQLQQQEKLQLSPIPVERHIEPEIVPDAPPPVAPPLPSYPATVAPLSTISDAIESVVKAAGDEASSNGSVGQPTGSSDGEEAPAKPLIENIEAPKLPDNLPPDLDTLVTKLKKAAHNSEEGKCKFFSEDVNKMLLSVELKSQQLTSTQRSTIYSHLASHLPCTKETLQKRAKKLRLDQEDGKLREPMQNLKNAIAEVMPDMLEKYAAALKAAEASREDEKSEAQNSQGTDDDTQGKEDKKVPQVPKKKFEWNDSIRKYLCDVVSIKMKCYEVSKTRVQSAEEYLKHFLDTEVRTLWPDGWMKARILFKESQAAHSYITNKQKKSVVVTKKSVNNVPPVVVSMKPAVSILNTAVLPGEPDVAEPLSLSDKLVPSQLVTPLTEEVAEKKENSDVSTGVTAVNNADKPSDLSKLITFPIKTTADLLLSPKHTEDGSAIQMTNSKLLIDVPAKSVAPTVNSKAEPVTSANAAVQKVIDKIIVTSQVSPTKQSSLTSTKISDMTSAFSEGSLASDMLARIICASLGNFPYAGSPAVDGSAEAKPQSVITSSSIIQNLKENRVVSSKLPTSDVVTSPKKFENVKPVNLELKKPSQDVVLQCNSQSIGSINIDALINAKLTPRPSDIGTTSVLIKKNLPEPSKPAVNLKLKDVIVPQSQQFAEAFERYGTESSTLIRKHSSKITNHHLQNFTLANASPPIRFSNASELPNEKTVNSSTRIALENAQRLSQDLVAKYANPTTSQSLLTAPLKKRSKYSQSSKTSSEQWSPYADVAHGATSLLEGMKGFPFPVNSLPTPPPAHCSAPHKTAASQPQDTTFTRLHAPPTSQRTSAHSASVLRVHQDSRGESTQAHPHVLVAEAPRRQSLIQGTWKANPTSQASSTSHSQYLSAGSPLISNPKSTSPNQHSSNTHKIPSPIHAHSHSAPLIEKVSPAHSQSPLPLRVSSSLTPQSVAHPAKTSSPSSIFSQALNQVQFPAHQSSHPSSTHQEQPPARNNSSFGAAHSPVTTVSSPAGSFPHSQEQSAGHPRTN